MFKIVFTLKGYNFFHLSQITFCYLMDPKNMKKSLTMPQ